MTSNSQSRNTVVLSVQGMSCGNCERHVREGLEQVDGVFDVNVDLARGRATVDYDAGRVGPAELTGAVERAGYGAELDAAGGAA